MSELPDPFERRYRELHRQGANGWNDAGTDAEILGLALELLAMAGIGNDACLLELGCGAGNISRGLFAAGYAVQGVDMSQTALHWARQARPPADRVAFCTCDLTEDWSAIPVRPYDAILDSLLLHCLTGARRASFLTRLADHMESGRPFLLMTMCGRPQVPAIRDAYDETDFTVYEAAVATNHIAPAEVLLEELRGHGLEPGYRRVVPAKDPLRDVDMLVAVMRRTPG